MQNAEQQHVFRQPRDIAMASEALTKLRATGVNEAEATKRIFDHWQDSGNTVESLTKPTQS